MVERKIAVGAGLGLPTSVILIWLFGVVWPEIVIPLEVAAAFGAVMSSVVGWATPNAK